MTLNTTRVALVTGGMGGLGEAICIKLAAHGLQGGRHLLARQHQGAGVARRDEGKQGLQAFAPIRATSPTSTRARRCVAQVVEEDRPDRRAGQQRRHHARHDLQEDEQGRLGRGHADQPRLASST